MKMKNESTEDFSQYRKKNEGGDLLPSFFLHFYPFIRPFISHSIIFRSCIRKAASEMFLPIFAGGETGVSVEDLREVALAGEGQDGCNLHGTVIRVDQHILGSLQLLTADIFTDGGPHLLLEQAGEIALTEVHMLCQLAHGDPGVKMIIDIVDTLCDLYGTDRIFSQIPHALGVFETHLRMQFGDIFGAHAFIRLLDEIVAESVGRRQFHTALDAVTGYQCSSDDKMKFQVLQGILGKLPESRLVYQRVLAELPDSVHIPGADAAVELDLGVVRRTEEFVFTLHKFFVEKFLIIIHSDSFIG